MAWTKNKARALLLWRTGALKFKNMWRIYNVKRGLGTNCVMEMCEGEDNFDHVKVCSFYDTKWSNKWCRESEIAQYLVKINRERIVKVKMPIL